jgi:hypothetical protein
MSSTKRRYFTMVVIGEVPPATVEQLARLYAEAVVAREQAKRASDVRDAADGHEAAEGSSSTGTDI